MSADDGGSGVGGQAAGYLAVGAGTALLELAGFRLLLAVGLGIAPANVAATAVATLANFALNRSAVFGASGRGARSAALYALLWLCNTAISSMAIPLLMSHGLPAAGAKLLMQGCVAAWNFVLYRNVVFR